VGAGAGTVEEGKEKGGRGLLKKRRRTSASLYLGRGSGQAGAGAILDVAGGEGGHGAAKLEGEVHRYAVSPKTFGKAMCLLLRAPEYSKRQHPSQRERAK
jgi:hypothetical protein